MLHRRSLERNAPLRAIQSIVAFTWVALSTPAAAVVPESGMYWNEREPGRGYYIEHQNGTVALAIYAYSEDDGEPEFFTAAGPLRDDAEPLEPLFNATNLYPIHGMAAPLYRSRGGACVTCGQKPPDASDRIGFVAIAFPSLDAAHMVVTASGRRKEVILTRMEFGTSRLYYPEGPPDLRGQWVVIDELAPLEAPLRYHFTERKSTPAQPSQSAEGYSVTYFDPSREAELRCASPNALGLSRAEAFELPRIGCELFERGEFKWSVVHDDIGLDRFQGSKQRLPKNNEAFRGAGRLIGVRIESK